MNRKKYTTVIYNGKQTDLNEAIYKATNGNRNRGHITTIKSVYNLSLQEAFEKCVECYFKTKAEKERTNVAYEIAAKTGKPVATIMSRIRKGVHNPESAEDLRKYNNVKTKYHVMYKGKLMSFKQAVEVATNGLSKTNPMALKRAKMYEGLDVQQSFELFVKRVRKKWGLDNATSDRHKNVKDI